ncbi:MAG: thioredoxin family protein [Candidatus Hodarchaeales archaeon]|jgi:peroxiredoxin
MSETQLRIGFNAPDFSLPGIDGKTYSLSSFVTKKIVIVLFSCNSCPVAQAYEDRLIRIQRDYDNRGVALIAINSNDAKASPMDSFEQMKERAKAKNFNFPYLRDETQEIAAIYGAERTPHLFVFDKARKMRYTGAIDDNWKEPDQVQAQHLREVLDALLENREISEPEIFAIGCAIHWKE